MTRRPRRPRRRRLTAAGLAVVAGTVLGVAGTTGAAGSAGAQASPGRAATDLVPTVAGAPVLTFANPNSQALLGSAYRSALVNLLKTNEIDWDPSVYDRSGLMDTSVKIIRAGGGYDQPWTRDASVNSWNAASLLAPAQARNTLWAAVDKDAAGRLQVQQDDQQWDQVIWVTAAWNHYLVTGNTTFLAHAYETSADTLAIREHATSAGPNHTYGLFTGASFFNDGIAGYPAPPADATESVSTGSMPWPGVASGMFLSTNELYYAAYVNAANMAQRLGRPSSEVRDYRSRAVALKKAINRYFWNPSTGLYNYMLLADGTPGPYQEGSGLAFALIFGIADKAQRSSILAHATEMRWGMPDTYPNWARYSDAQPGRHNAIVWPLVQGLWAKALAGQGDQAGFATETAHLAELADDNSGFWEIYNGNTGIVDGGYQRLGDTVKFHWGSEPDQTWSATAFLNMMTSGLFGLTFTDEGLRLAPTLPAGWGDVTMRKLHYRGATLSIALHGAGNHIRSMIVDGRATSNHVLPTDLTGQHSVDIVLGGAPAGDRDQDGVPDAQDRCPDTAGPADLQGCPSADLIQAEDALNTGGVKTNDNHTGYDGRAFVDGLWAQGAASTFFVHRTSSGRGTASLTLRYANANDDARTMTLSVDGRPVRQITLPKVSDSWDDWGTTTVDDVPVRGADPRITISYGSGDTGSINLDWLQYRES